MAPENSASIAAGPALNVFASSFVLPRDCWKKPLFTPTSAGAWVMFGKYPSRMVFASPLVPEEESSPHAVRAVAVNRAVAARASARKVRELMLTPNS